MRDSTSRTEWCIEAPRNRNKDRNMRLKDIRPGQAFIIIEERERECRRNEGPYMAVSAPGDTEPPENFSPCVHLFTGELFAYPAAWEVACVRISFSLKEKN